MAQFCAKLSLRMIAQSAIFSDPFQIVVKPFKSLKILKVSVKRIKLMPIANSNKSIVNKNNIQPTILKPRNNQLFQ